MLKADTQTTLRGDWKSLRPCSDIHVKFYVLSDTFLLY